MIISVLAVGDVCGAPGLKILEQRLKAVRKERGISFVVVNGESATASSTPART